MKTHDLGPKPWYERLLDWLERWRLVTGLVLLAFVIGGGFTLLLMEKLRKPEIVVTETREVTEEQIIEETPTVEPTKLSAVKGATTKPGASTQKQPSEPQASQSSPTSSVKPTGKININTASAAALESLNGIGPKLAERIIEYRNANGSFKSPEQIKDVKGIGDKTFEKFKDEITI